MSYSISSRCLPACEVTCTQPCAYSNSLEPCVASCGDSTAVVYAPPVIVTFPGPIISSCPQESYVGTSFPQSSGALASYSSGNSYGVGGSSSSGGVSGSGIASGYGSSYGSGGSFGYGGYSGIGGCYSNRRCYSSSLCSRVGKCGSY